jgi:hypothetical protein
MTKSRFVPCVDLKIRELMLAEETMEKARNVGNAEDSV